MNFLIFSDIDGTLLDHDNYSFGNLKNFIAKIKDKVLVIFNSSKTFAEIIQLNEKLKLNFPFIIENGACIFFPSEKYFLNLPNKNFFKYRGHTGYKLTKLNNKSIEEKLSHLKKKFDFTFFNQLSNLQIGKITKLKNKSIINSKKRLFTNPILWTDTDQKYRQFKIDVKKVNKTLKVSKGGRFIHISDGYDKGTAMIEFIKIYNFKNSKNLITISLGDNENDLSMLELTDYSCIVKSEGINISLKKKKNIYYSKKIAPSGWQESLEFVFKKENKDI